jgi:ketosteroid isomerase-like protein
MSHANVELVRSILSAWEHGDLSAGPSDFDENLVFVSRPEFAAFGVFLGIDALSDFMRDFLDQWEWTRFQALRFRAVGDTVIVDVVQHGKGKASGLEGQFEPCWVPRRAF